VLESGSLPRIWLFAGSLACARTDGASVSSGGRERHSILTRCSFPLGSPIWGFTVHVGGRAPSLEFRYIN
jgi:hypothetical protein